ncbi:hypothetical protein RI367_005425 [Sorochytrium milnesiophthora]
MPLATVSAASLWQRLQDLALCVQTYLQAIVIVQRLHIVNSYKIEAESAITLGEVLHKRRLELIWTVTGFAVITLRMSPLGAWAIYIPAFAWLLSIIIMDMVLSVVTLNKVHRMLNTHHNTWSWAWRALRPGQCSTASLKAPNSAAQPLAQEIDAIGRRIVRVWSLLTASIICAAGIYVISVLERTKPWHYPLFHLAWIFGSLWQRSNMLYVEAVRHIMLTNRRSKQFLGKETKTGIQLAVTDFAFSGALSIVQDIIQPLAAAPTYNFWVLLQDLAVLLQTYFQALVIVQRLHIVNAYKIDSHAITAAEFLSKRWLELVWTIFGIIVTSIRLSYPGPWAVYASAVVWLLSIIVMDIMLSISTLNKVHRMLNTQQDTWSWARQALRIRQGTPARASITQPVAHDVDDNTRRLVQAWTLLTASIVCAAGIYLASVLQRSTPLHLPLFHLAWVFGCLWQRNAMLYVEAVKHVMVTNRRSKQFVGTATKTGIQLDGRSVPISLNER